MSSLVDPSENGGGRVSGGGGHRRMEPREKFESSVCAKHGINRETIAEETIASTVDQHNSFKASCTLNEKEAGASDTQPMPNASKECHLLFTDLINGGDVLGAIGRAYITSTECGYHDGF
ncbi:hypothetical protein TIFTF001_028163 [Ficus carica]|uniref:Uncharacterized protein n=1 Tax=Ficus carica TaxID=3494 RepID=A0AA88DPF1_FICCA|nr:hypothetical protein TIFTF001_028163 [Ficus carica]